MTKGKEILSPTQFTITLDRLSYELVERYDDFGNTVLIGIQPRGIYLANRLFEKIHGITNGLTPQLGKLDTTFYRDDFRRHDEPLSPNTTDIEFLVEGKNVILVDDVLYSGRTIQAALAALQQFGRPRQVELAVLVDRRFNRHLPIQADYVGITVDAVDQAYVRVSWQADDKGNTITLFKSKPGE